MLPNLLLAGAPKCGTTSVYDWLVDHPKISGGIDKELFYLMDKNDWKYEYKNSWLTKGNDGYQKLFLNKNRWLVDGTTLSIYQETAMDFAKANGTKAIFFLREPSKRIFSTYNYFKDNRTVLNKDTSFSEFIDSVNKGEKFKGNNQLSDVFEQSNYIQYLGNWKKSIGLSNMRVYLFEDLIQNPTKIMHEICEWLEIEKDFYDAYMFKSKNESLVIKNRSLNVLKESIASKVKFKAVKDKIRPLYYKLNSQPKNKEISNDELILLGNIKSQFIKSNQLLFDEFGIDLEKWA